MVDSTAAKIATEALFVDLPEEALGWSSVLLSELVNGGMRLDASYFKIEGKHAREVIQKSRWAKQALTGKDGLGYAYHRPRFRRIFVGSDGIPIYQPSQINEIYPRAELYISKLTGTHIEELRVKENQILLTCSGTIGNVALVSKTLDNSVFSHDVIRINVNDQNDVGYVYAFLRTKIGHTLITTNNYGAVVQHIEPAHLENILVPNPDGDIKKKIGDLTLSSFRLRDESNRFIDQAEAMLVGELKLPPIEKLRSADSALHSYEVRLSLIDERFDASYHIPVADAIINEVKASGSDVLVLGDAKISKRIILPGRFKRVYVKEGQGRVFFGGKQIYELDPSNKKYLSLVHHEARIKEQLQLEENMVMITCSGTVGKVAIAPKHWEGWTANQHIIRVVPSSNEIAGYICAWLNSEYGYELIKRFTYGAVVDEIDANHVSKVEIPILKNGWVRQKINSLVLEANQKRYKAYVLEQEALRQVNELVIYAE